MTPQYTTKCQKGRPRWVQQVIKALSEVAHWLWGRQREPNTTRYYGHHLQEDSANRRFMHEADVADSDEMPSSSSVSEVAISAGVMKGVKGAWERGFWCCRNPTLACSCRRIQSVYSDQEKCLTGRWLLDLSAKALQVVNA